MANIRPLSQRNCHGDIKGLALNQRLLLLEQGQELEGCWKPVHIQALGGQFPLT